MRVADDGFSLALHIHPTSQAHWSWQDFIGEQDLAEIFREKWTHKPKYHNFEEHSLQKPISQQTTY